MHISVDSPYFVDLEFGSFYRGILPVLAQEKLLLQKILPATNFYLLFIFFQFLLKYLAKKYLWYTVFFFTLRRITFLSRNIGVSNVIVTSLLKIFWKSAKVRPLVNYKGLISFLILGKKQIYIFVSIKII